VAAKMAMGAVGEASPGVTALLYRAIAGGAPYVFRNRRVE